MVNKQWNSQFKIQNLWVHGFLCDFEAGEPSNLGMVLETRTVHNEEITKFEKFISRGMYIKEYESAYKSSPMWNAIEAPTGEVFQWNEFCP